MASDFFPCGVRCRIEGKATLSLLPRSVLLRLFADQGFAGVSLDVPGPRGAKIRTSPRSATRSYHRPVIASSKGSLFQATTRSIEHACLERICSHNRTHVSPGAGPS